MNKTILTMIALALIALAAEAQQATNSADWYPASITPPAGHQYPCALTALPKDLTGIPASDKLFVNHVYAMLLKCLQAKLVLIDTLNQDKQNYSRAYSTYCAETLAARKRIMAEPAPKGLEPFKTTVLKAIDTQMQFFTKGVDARNQGKTAQEVWAIPEGKQASSLLISAWGQMEGRYPQMSPAVRDSTYHHLCALDLF
jgi:hypothetical protein